MTIEANVKTQATKKLSFASDYMEGAHEEILKRLHETNMEQSAGYGLDEYSEMAKAKIKDLCKCPDGEVYFLVGGTQTNATVIDAMLRPYEGVIAAETGHISVHEAGAIEYGGHKVLPLPQVQGKIKASDVEDCVKAYQNDDNRDHMVMPSLVYISQPTEYGALYSLEELKELRQVCDNAGLRLYIDGARLAYALGSTQNTISLADLGNLADAFYIGGTKCGAFFGEAVVFPKKNTVPHFFTIIKQHGALFAKGRILGIQFDTLFTNSLYQKLGTHAIQMADKIRTALEAKGYELAFKTPTNQIFVVLDTARCKQLEEKVVLGFWEKIDSNKKIMRIATSWATQESDVDALIELL